MADLFGTAMKAGSNIMGSLATIADPNKFAIVSKTADTLYDKLIGQNVTVLGMVLKGEPLDGKQGQRAFALGLALGGLAGVGGTLVVQRAAGREPEEDAEFSLEDIVR